MSGPDTITIQVDNSGALTAIAGTAEAINQLGEAARAAAGQFQAISQAESPFQTMLGQLSATIPVLADANSLMGKLTTFQSSLSGLAAPFLGQAAAATTATAATSALRVVMNSLPLVAVAGAVATLGVGLYELFTRSQDNVGGFKDMDGALTALRPLLGGSNEDLSTFAKRMDEATVSTRRLTQASLEAVKAAGTRELKSQQDAAEKALNTMQARLRAAAPVDAMGGNFVTPDVPDVDPGVLAAFQRYAADASKDVQKLGAELQALGPAGTEALNSLVEFNGKQVPLLELIAAAKSTRDGLDKVDQQLRVVTNTMTDADRAQLTQATTMNDAGQAALALAACQQQLAQQTRAATQAAEEGVAAAGLQAQGATLMAEALATSTQSMAASLVEFDTQLQADFQKSLIGQEELDKATKAKTDAAAAAAASKAQAEEVNKAADQIAGGWADAMFNQITGKGGSIKNWFKGLFKQIAVDALKNKIALPIVTGVMGGAMGALAGGGVGGLLGAAAAPAMPGSAPAPGGGILSGLSGILDGFEKGITDLGSKLFGAAGANGAAGTSGLFGSGGQLFGSTGLANGVSGAFAGAGLGATAAGLLGALGLGKGNTKGGAIGGAIGGAAGSIFGPLGTTVGSLLGGAIGSLFGGKPSNKEGSATIDLNSGNVAVGGFTGKKFSQENRDQASGIAGEVLKIKDALEKGFGARITGTLAVGAGDRDGLFATALNSSARTSFKDDKAGAEQLLAYVTGQFVTAIRDQLSPAMSAALGRVDFKDMEKALGDLEFIRSFEDSITALGEGMGVVNQVTREARAEVDEQVRSLKDFKEKTARLFPDDIDRAATAMRAYVEELVGITDAAPPMTQVETALMALQARFEAYKPLLEEVGYTAEQAQTAIANGLQKAKDKLRGEFNDSLDRQYNDLTGKGYVNQINDLVKTRDAGRRDATALGLTAEKVDRNFGAALDSQFEGLDSAALNDIKTQFQDMAPVVEAADRALARLNGTAQDMATLSQIARDRRALEIQIMELQGKGVEALAARRADELAAADATLRPLIEQRHALEDAAKATELATSRRALEIQIMEMQGKSAEALAARRADELAAADATLRPLIEQRHALEDAAKATELATSRRALEIQIMEMQGKSAEALAARRADELAAADATLRPLIEQRHALEDAAKATELATSRRALEIQIMELAGDAAGALAARRADELAAADASLRPLIERRHALEDEARAAELARAARGQEIQILELQGRSSAALALRRREELNAADAALRPMIAYRHALEDEAAARAASLALSDRLFNATNDANTLTGALAAFDRDANRERAEAARSGTTNLVQLETVLAAERGKIVQSFLDKDLEAAQAKADQARDTLISAYEREADAARTLASSWRQAGDGIRAALKADSLSDPYTNLNADQRASLAEQELRDLAARAGDSSLSAEERLAAAQALPAARRAFLDAVRPLYEGTERWGEALDLSAQLLDGVALSASREVDIAQQQVDLAQRQLTALGVVNQSVLTVAQALADYQAAQAQVAAARAAAQTVTPAPASPAGVPANSNQPALTLDRVRGDLLSTPFTTHDLDGTAIARFTGPNGNSISLLASDLQTRPVEYLAEMARQLGLAGYQQGGVVGNGIRGVDSVLARYQDGGLIGLAGGEFVTRAAAVTAETLPFLRAINDSGRPPPILSGVADTSRLERLLQDLLTQTASTGRSMADLNARGYEALVNRLEGLLSQGQDQAADRRRVAR